MGLEKSFDEKNRVKKSRDSVPLSEQAELKNGKNGVKYISRNER
jgi:hypothetical protein